MKCPEHGKEAKRMASNRWWCDQCCGMMVHQTKDGPMMGNGHGHYWKPRDLRKER